MENQRGVVLTLIAGAVAIGIFVRSLVRSVMVGMLIEDPTLGGVLALSWLLGLAGGVVGFVLLLRTSRVTTFTDECITELSRVHWPPREETVSNTGIVVGATIFFSVLLGFYDAAWSQITQFFLYSSG